MAMDYRLTPSLNGLKSLKPGQRVPALDPWTGGRRAYIQQDRPGHFQIGYFKNKKLVWGDITAEDALDHWLTYHTRVQRPGVEKKLSRRGIERQPF